MTNQTLNSGFGTLSWDIDVSAGSEVAFVLGDYGNLNNIGNPVVLSQLMNVGPGTSNCSASIPQSVSPVPFSTATGLTSATGMSISSDSSNNAGAIAGGVIGGVSGVLLIITIALFVMRMHNRRKRMAAQQQFALKIWRHSGPDRSAQAGKRYTDLPEEPEQSMPVQSMPVRGEAS
ncbi:hypothetical protein DACRYDRAFT_22592 [Dacryopinax primogenitus]|uniref:Mid2 domain-containing protein n=1 Tax=Dacryopinax primogenitus (strain DJM 731) TaxID=1858805 RepID=M5GBR9_DACPD|nr:uncharacterized protein DACRYDRAFT_22592 [Dacryopinax primogenitus]EJU01463.1 hypothetical protein DACRYDRAFT_22592 [Dacryopinax primogenitus]